MNTGCHQEHGKHQPFAKREVDDPRGFVDHHERKRDERVQNAGQSALNSQRGKEEHALLIFAEDAARGHTAVYYICLDRCADISAATLLPSTSPRDGSWRCAVVKSRSFPEDFAASVALQQVGSSDRAPPISLAGQRGTDLGPTLKTHGIGFFRCWLALPHGGGPSLARVPNPLNSAHVIDQSARWCGGCQPSKLLKSSHS